jgi:hypothetical protein
MHRSGTSLIAGILHKCGIFLGTDLLGENISNPFGHFEDQRLLDLNNKILTAAGGTWFEPPTENAIYAQADRMKEEIVSALSHMPAGTWGWKDPRLSLTIELFLPYLHNPVFIICNREATAIAESLYRRDGIEMKSGLSIACIYQDRIKRIIEHHPDVRRMVVTYEKICSDPASVISRLISFIGLDVHPRQYRAAKRFVVPRKVIRRLERRIRRNELIKAGFHQLYKNPIVFFEKLVKHIGIKSSIR